LIREVSNFIRMADISRGVRGLSMNSNYIVLLEESTASGNTALWYYVRPVTCRRPVQQAVCQCTRYSVRRKERRCRNTLSYSTASKRVGVVATLQTFVRRLLQISPG